MTHDLLETSGLPLTLDEHSGLLAADGFDLPQPGVRRWGELRDVLAGPAPIAPDDSRPCYLLYRDVGHAEDRARLRRHGLRYDLTVTLPGRVGQELPKTAGHYHSAAPDGVTYPEIYEVLHGHAAFVLQRVSDPTSLEPAILDVWIARCRPGDAIVIPPDCGHVTVNLGEDPLVVSDLVADACRNNYGSFRHAHGAAVYLMAGAGPNTFRIAANPRYGTELAPVVFSGPRPPPQFAANSPLYPQARAAPAQFRFLTHPAAAADWMLGLWTN